MQQTTENWVSAGSISVKRHETKKKPNNGSSRKYMNLFRLMAAQLANFGLQPADNELLGMPPQAKARHVYACAHVRRLSTVRGSHTLPSYIFDYKRMNECTKRRPKACVRVCVYECLLCCVPRHIRTHILHKHIRHEVIHQKGAYAICENYLKFNLLFEPISLSLRYKYIYIYLIIIIYCVCVCVSVI